MFIKDGLGFSSNVIPPSNLKDPDAFCHQVMLLFSDRGITDVNLCAFCAKGYRFTNGSGGHTFKLVNEEGRVHFKTEQKFKNLNAHRAEAGHTPILLY